MPPTPLPFSKMRMLEPRFVLPDAWPQNRALVLGSLRYGTSPEAFAVEERGAPPSCGVRTGSPLGPLGREAGPVHGGGGRVPRALGGLRTGRRGLCGAEGSLRGNGPVVYGPPGRRRSGAVPPGREGVASPTALPRREEVAPRGSQGEWFPLAARGRSARGRRSGRRTSRGAGAPCSPHRQLLWPPALRSGGRQSRRRAALAGRRFPTPGCASGLSLLHGPGLSLQSLAGGSYRALWPRRPP